MLKCFEIGILCGLSGESRENIERMNAEFADCRKISITNMPAGKNEKEVKTYLYICI